MLCITGLVPALLFGVAVGNVILGVPFRLGDDMRIYYDGSFFGLLTPFALLCGLVSLSMLLMHGAAWLMFKTDGEVASRAARYGTWFAVLTTVLFAAAGLWLATGINGYVITSEINPVGPSNPLNKTAAVAAGAWMANFKSYPLLWLVPGIGLLMPSIIDTAANRADMPGADPSKWVAPADLAAAIAALATPHAHGPHEGCLCGGKGPHHG